MTRRFARFVVPALIVTLAACTTERTPPGTADTAAAGPRPIVTVTPVNNYTYGMMSRVRWAFSPDRGAILVVVDPVGVEAEPVANSFFFGVEEPTFAVQVDTVWDVAPSPDWRTVAFSKAYRLASGESEFVPAEQWQELSRATGMDTATLRAGAFDASAMAYAKAIAQPAVIQVPADPRAGDAAAASRARTFPIARGWRVRWTADGSLVALGSNPQLVQDDAPSQNWAALDPRTGALSVSLPAGARMVETQWTSGPELGVGLNMNVNDAPPITVRVGELNYVIESVRGVISLRDPAFQTRAAVPIGPGVALAATASGRYVVAMRPRQPPREHESPVEVVVYRVTM